MFTRNSDREAPPGIPTTMTPSSAANPAKPPPVNGGAVSNSVIGRDLTIIGSGLKIVSRGVLQVDGEVQGDVMGEKIVIGQTGKVTGLVNAAEILVHGAVFGTIKAVDVKLAASAVVEGDLYHQTFALEQGASFEGRSRRAANRDDLVPDLAALAPAAGETS
jgi:cytoskeletal protein CcmA (bactofilin family)